VLLINVDVDNKIIDLLVISCSCKLIHIDMRTKYRTTAEYFASILC